MDEKLIKLLMDYYLTSELEFIDRDETEAETMFYNDIINPVWDCNKKAGRELENKYSELICAVEQQSFKNGFLSCKNFLIGNGMFS